MQCAIGYLEDLDNLFDVSLIPELYQNSSRPLRSPRRARTQIPSRNQVGEGSIGRIEWKFRPKEICFHKSDTVNIEFLMVKPQHRNNLEIRLENSGKQGTCFQISRNDLKQPLPTEPGFHLVPVLYKVCKKAEKYKFLSGGDPQTNLYAHYCVGVPENFSLNTWDCSDPFDIPMPRDPRTGEPSATKTRNHCQLQLSQTVIESVSSEYVNREGFICPLCNCEIEGSHQIVSEEIVTTHAKTDGISVTPSSLVPPGYFSVTGLEPSTDYGSDVFVYRWMDWYNRGRYTVLGMSNYLALADTPIENPHILVGKEYPVKVWTAIELPTSSIQLRFSNSKATLLLLNNNTHEWDTVLSPTNSTAIFSIQEWKSNYVQGNRNSSAKLIANDISSNVLSFSFLGRKGDISITQEERQEFTAHRLIAEPISAAVDSNGYVYNPSGIPYQREANYRVLLEPMSPFTNSNFIWDTSGLLVVSPQQTGPKIRIRGTRKGDFSLGLQINGLWMPKETVFTGCVLDYNRIPITTWIVGNNPTSPIPESQVFDSVMQANKILFQAGIELIFQSYNFTNRTDWYTIHNADSSANAPLIEMLNCTQGTQGLELYLVNEMFNENSEPVLGVNRNEGIAMTFAGLRDARALAHEILHRCGLVDIYVSNNESLEVTGLLSQERLPQDWCGGHYPPNITQQDIIKRLIMYGFNASFTGSPGFVLPRGVIDGIAYTNATPTSPNIYYQGNIAVGQTGLLTHTPYHQ